MARHRSKLLAALAATLAWPAGICLAQDEPPARPLTLEQTGSAFGRLSVERHMDGAVLVTPDGRKETRGGARDLGGFHEAATFLVTGEPGRSFLITLPDEVGIESRGLHNGRLEAFTTLPRERGELNAAGRAEIRLGATLRLPPGAKGSFDESYRIFVDYDD